MKLNVTKALLLAGFVALAANRTEGQTADAARATLENEHTSHSVGGIRPSSWSTYAKDMFFNCIDIPDGIPLMLGHYEDCMEVARTSQKECEQHRDRFPGFDRPIPLTRFGNTGPKPPDEARRKTEALVKHITALALKRGQ